MSDKAGCYLDVSGEDGSRLRVTFRWHADRYAHRITLHASEQVIHLLSSREGDAHKDWPPSPPLQQISQAQLPDGRRALLLVGMAGKNHWSLSVATDPDQQELVFDVACRANVSPDQLGSSYQLERGPGPHTPGSVILHPAPRSNPVCVHVPAGKGTAPLVITETRLTIGPGGERESVPATFRWKYHVGWRRSTD